MKEYMTSNMIYFIHPSSFLFGQCLSRSQTEQDKSVIRTTVKIKWGNENKADFNCHSISFVFAWCCLLQLWRFRSPCVYDGEQLQNLHALALAR